MDRGKVLLGLTLTTVGVVLLLGAVDVLDAGAVLSQWWPVVVIAAGVIAMVGRPPAVISGGIVAVVGAVLLGITTEVLDESVWAVLWPAVLISVGLYVLLGRRAVPRGGLGRGHSTDDRLDVTCVFSGREVISLADPFRGGSIVGVFGGVELDLTGAVLPAGGATLDVIAVFGGADITVPSGWRVRINGPAIFGGFENGADAQFLPDDAPTLDVRATAIFGGVTIEVAAPRRRTAPASAASPVEVI